MYTGECRRPTRKASLKERPCELEPSSDGKKSLLELGFQCCFYKAYLFLTSYRHIPRILETSYDFISIPPFFHFGLETFIEVHLTFLYRGFPSRACLEP